MQRVLYLPINHERILQKLVEKVGVGFLRKHPGV